MIENDSKVTRRQFLNYSVMGVGGFMAAGILMPMIRTAIDPILKESSNSEMVPVVTLSEITNEPQRFDFKVLVKDGWIESEQIKSAWLYTDDKGEVVALSPKCNHLGCVVNWNGDPKNPNRFYCPCHDGYFEKDGSKVPNTPPLGPLDRYAFEVKDGTIYLGKLYGMEEV